MDTLARASFSIYVSKDKTRLIINMYDSYISPHFWFSGVEFEAENGWIIKAGDQGRIFLDQAKKIIVLPVATKYAVVQQYITKTDSEEYDSVQDQVLEALTQWADNEWLLEDVEYQREICIDACMTRPFSVYAYHVGVETKKKLVSLKDVKEQGRNATIEKGGVVVIDLPIPLQNQGVDLNWAIFKSSDDLTSLIKTKFAEVLQSVDENLSFSGVVDSMIYIRDIDFDVALTLARLFNKCLNDIGDTIYDDFVIYDVVYPSDPS
jgi:hypothetical protein